MRLLLDQGLPAGASPRLRAQGFDVLHVSEIGMSAATDRQILELADDDDRVVVTLDADFHALLAADGARRPSVIRIRLEGLDATALASLVGDTLSLHNTDLLAGAVATVRRDGTVAVRPLPLS